MHISELDMMQVRLLAELVELRNLSAAADRVGLSQSAASHACARLRTRFNDPLFVRVRGGIHLTPMGERLGVAARQAVDALQAGMSDELTFDPLTTSHVFDLYLNEVGQMVFLPKLLAFLAREAPGASLRTRPIDLAGPSVALASNEGGLAVGFFTNLAAGFRQSLVFQEHYVCVVRADHEKFRKGMQLEAFGSVSHAVAEPSGMAHTVIERTLKANGIFRTVKLRAPDFMVLPLVVAQSDLLAIVPSRLAQAFAARIAIKVMRPPVPIPGYDIRAFWHDRFHTDPANRWLRKNFIRLFHRARD